MTPRGAPSFHFTDGRAACVVRQQVWAADRAKTPGRSRPPPQSRPVTARKEDGRPRPELRKRWKGESKGFLLGEAGSPGGRAATPTPGGPRASQAGPAPAPRPLERSLPARWGEAESGAGFCPPPSPFCAHTGPLTWRRPRKSRTPGPREVRPPARIPPSPPEKRRAAGYGQAGKGAAPRGSRGGRWRHRRGRDRGACGWPRLPVSPRGVLTSGLGVAVERARLQVAAVSGDVAIQIPQTLVESKQSSDAAPLAPQPSTEDSSGPEMMGLPIRILEFCCEKWKPLLPPIL